MQLNKQFEKSKLKKTVARIIAEATAWVILAISSLYCAIFYLPNSIFYWFVEIFWMTMIGFYVYDDSRKRYQKWSWNIGWAVATGIFFPLFIVYYSVRLPVAFETVGTRFQKKLVFSIIATTILILSLSLLKVLF